MAFKAAFLRLFRRTTNSNHALPIAENVLARKFDADAPNSVWITDITYTPTTEGWLYLAAILDLYSHKVVGCAMSDGMETQLYLAALDIALQARQPPLGLVHHSDRGSQYASIEYRQRLDANGIVCGMSRRADCWDNAVAENCWTNLKLELVSRTTFQIRAAARLAIFEFIEVFYNRQRLPSHLGFRSPTAFESLVSSVPLAA